MVMGGNSIRSKLLRYVELYRFATKIYLEKLIRKIIYSGRLSETIVTLERKIFKRAKITRCRNKER